VLINFFHTLREVGIPVTTRELLDLYEGLQQHVAFGSPDEFYFLSRTCLVKDEKYFDRFDKAFGHHFKELQELDDIIEALIPDDWLRSEFMKELSEEDKAKIESLGGLENSSKSSRNAWKSRRSATRAATSGWAPAAPHPSASRAITPRESAWGRTVATVAP
jgi:uncharacterized protein with von Willebrand factor type A (vWA) domain